MFHFDLFFLLFKVILILLLCCSFRYVFVVTWSKARRGWSSSICVGGVFTAIGAFADEIEAAQAYDAYIVKCRLFRKINFPPLEVCVN